MKHPELLTDEYLRKDYKALWKCLTGDHSKCNDGCPGKKGGKKKAKALISVERLRQFRTPKKACVPTYRSFQLKTFELLDLSNYTYA